ncbi:hypothetical protein [Nocardia tengchongensis]|uniref:hypothetical protein n=1 Tax=Nocardia tengchongensis TaxID=2055889 RepID=UPI00369AC71D
MTETPTLDELVERASIRHNGASGRRLAEIAQQAGYEVSHATLNRIRRGTYRSTPTDQTLKAVAFLAGVDADVAYSAAAAELETTRRTADLYFEWARLQFQSRQLTYEYARSRDISPDEAGRELAEILEMDEDRRHGRPWTPPWDPGPQFGERDTPWLASWWRVEPKEVDLSARLGGEFAGMKVHQIGLPKWASSDQVEMPDLVRHVFSRHPAVSSFVLEGVGDGPVWRTVVYVTLRNNIPFHKDLAEQDLEGLIVETQRDENDRDPMAWIQQAVELVVVEKFPVAADGEPDIAQLRTARRPALGDKYDRSPDAPPRTIKGRQGATGRDRLSVVDDGYEVDENDQPIDEEDPILAAFAPEDGDEDKREDDDFEGR